jgi:hypothetical protein
MKHPLQICSSLLLASTLAGQQFTETFPFPNGPTIPGWTQRNNGNWSIINGRLRRPADRPPTS